MSTGDVGHFDAGGRLFVDGRDDEMIVSGGENVFPREVEDLLADHAEIEEVAVVGVPDDEFGQRLRAFVVPRDGGELTRRRCRPTSSENLARYKVPREVVFVDELPRNATGKVLKRELQTQLLALVSPLASLERDGAATHDFDLGRPAAEPRGGAPAALEVPIEPLMLGSERYAAEPRACRWSSTSRA